MALFLAFIGLSSGSLAISSLYFGKFQLSSLILLLIGIIPAYRKKRMIPLFASFFFGIAIMMPFILSKGKEGSYQGMIIEARENYFILRVGFHKYYVQSNGHLYQVGDFIKIEGEKIDFIAPQYESKFYFGDYLLSKGIKEQIIAKKIDSLFSFPLRFRKIQLAFLSHIKEEYRPLIDSIVFNRGNKDGEALEIASSIGATSILSSSGLIYSFLIRNIRKRLNYQLNPSISEWIIVLMMLLLLPFYISKIGVIRVLIYTFLKALNNSVFKKRFETLELISLTGIIMLIIEPFNVFQLAFQIGFILSILLYFSKSINKRRSKIKTSVLRFILVYLVIFLFSLTTAYIHPFSLLYSMLLLPLVILTYVSSLLALIGIPIYGLIDFEGLTISKILSFLSKIDLNIRIIPLNKNIIMALFIIILLGFFLYDLHLKKINLFLAITCLAIYGLSAIPIDSLFIEEVSFINVGQGDAILIRDRFHNVMIDTGGITSFDLAKESLIPYFMKRRIYSIDAVIASHHDYDHIGAYYSLNKNFNVGRFIDEKDDFPYKIGNLTFENHNLFNGADENDNSLVLTLKFMDKRWLFTGDASSEVERKIINNEPNLDCDILKVGHHGSSSSSCLEFLETISPEVAIISCGAKNKFGHPNKDVLERLKKLGIKIRRTDKEGTITYKRFMKAKL